MGMASAMDNALASLAGVIEDAAGETVTYRRNSRPPVEKILTACPGRRTPSRAAVAQGLAQLEVEPMDWLVRPELIDFGAGAVEPQRGDRITRSDGTIYEVAPRDGEPEWRLSDAFRHALRVRTIRVT